MLDVRRLRVLREVAARGTIAAAARSLAYTPSAVSQQLTALEREAGVALLDRGGGRIALTEAGRGLVRRTEGILDDLEAAEAELEATAALVGGTVRIACFPSAARALLAPALAALRARHPLLDARLEELEPEASLPALRMGEVDVAISHENARHPPRTEERLQRDDLFEEPLLVALPEGHPALRGHATGPVSLATLAGERWIATPPGSACHALLEDACAQVGFVPTIAYRTNDFGVISTFVAAGLGVGLMPTLAQSSFGEGVVLRPVGDAHAARRIYVAARRGTAQRPAVNAVLDALRTATG
jgi:DNA-binding transcriptional LysR family regulator